LSTSPSSLHFLSFACKLSLSGAPLNSSASSSLAASAKFFACMFFAIAIRTHTVRWFGLSGISDRNLVYIAILETVVRSSPNWEARDDSISRISINNPKDTLYATQKLVSPFAVCGSGLEINNCMLWLTLFKASVKFPFSNSVAANFMVSPGSWAAAELLSSTGVTNRIGEGDGEGEGEGVGETVVGVIINLGGEVDLGGELPSGCTLAASAATVCAERCENQSSSCFAPCLY